MVFLQLLLMIRSFGRPLSQLLAWAKHPCMDKGTALGKRDTTLPHRHTFTRKIIPETDKRLDEENMARLKAKMKKIGGTIMSDGWQSTTSRPIINVILGFCTEQKFLSEGHG